MIHLRGSYFFTKINVKHNNVESFCKSSVSLDDVIKFDDVHKIDKTIDCPKCATEVVTRLKQKRQDLALNAVSIHNKQVKVNELIDKYSSVAE
jgi:queuine/archaeosine tRNA-ribosyltransferase